jgi:uncharacterized protein
LQLSGGSGQVTALDRSTIAVLGHGKATATPDVLKLYFGVSVRRPNVGDALQVANAKTRRVVAALRSRGVEARDIQTNDLSIGQSYARGKPNGYTVTNTVRATIRHIDRAGDAISAAAQAAGNDARLQGVNFDVENRGGLQSKARRVAVANAFEKAREYARAAGRRVGKVLAVSEFTSGGGPAFPIPAGAPAVGGGGELGPVPIEQGQQDITVDVAVLFELV